MAELICVDPSRIGEVWPLTSDLVLSAVRRTRLSDPADIERDILNGNSLLWLASDGRSILAAAVSHLTRIGADKVCTITACAGEDMPEWLPLFEQIEDYAKAEGCRCVRIYGRRGWLRVLRGYEMTHAIIEKVL